MEIFKNNTWENLCTTSWDKHERIQTCMAIGYFEKSGYDKETWYKYSNATNTTIRRNCSSLTNCLNKNVDKFQLCKGIYHNTIVNCITLLALPISLNIQHVSIYFNVYFAEKMKMMLEVTYTVRVMSYIKHCKHFSIVRLC